MQKFKDILTSKLSGITSKLGTELTIEQQVFAALFEQSGSYPKQAEVDRGVQVLMSAGAMAFGEWVSQAIPKNKKLLFTPEREFIFPEPKDIFIDVTQTQSFHINTGIQRVVRMLTSSWKAAGFQFELVRFDFDIGTYVVLSARETQAFFNWQENSFSRLSLKKRAFRASIGRLLGPKLTAVSKSLLHQSRRFKSKFGEIAVKSALRIFARPCDQETLKVLIPIQGMIVIPELCDQRRVETVLSCLRYFPLKLGMVVYDLIPLYWPEVHTISSEFVHYLRLAQRAHKISCISKATELMLASYLDGARLAPDTRMPQTAVHYLGAGLAQFRGEASANEFYEKLKQQDPGLPLIVCVGTIEPRKNHLRIIRALSLLHAKGLKFRVVVIGYLGWNMQEAWREMLEYTRQGLPIEFAHDLDEQTLARIYAKAAFSVYCSLVEGFGLPVLESLVHGTPVVTSNRGSMKEIAERVGGCVLVNPENVTDIAGGIEELLIDRQKYQLLQAQAKEVTWPSWREYGDITYEFFRSEN